MCSSDLSSLNAQPGDGTAPPIAPPPVTPAALPTLAQLWSHLPDRAGPFRRNEVSQPPVAPDGTEGLMARYAARLGSGDILRDAEATLFLYGRPGQPVADGASVASLVTELDIDTNNLRDEIRHRPAGRNAIANESTAFLGAGGAPLLQCRVLELTPQPHGRGEPARLRSETLCIGGAAGRVVKLYVVSNYREVRRAQMQQDISELAIALLRGIHDAQRG